jgi:hypothetical protein
MGYRDYKPEITPERLQEAEYRAAAAYYAAKHKHDKPQPEEPEQETDAQRMRRYMGLNPTPQPQPERKDFDAWLTRRMREADQDGAKDGNA